MSIELPDELVIGALRESARNCIRGSAIIDDRRYARTYVEHVNAVLSHFGGQPVPIPRKCK